MELSKEDVQEIITDVTTNLKSEVVRDLTKTLNWEVSQESRKMVVEHVHEWVKENVLPDVTAILIEGKASLVNAAAQASENMCDALSDSLVAALKENLEKSWNRKKLFEAMFT